MEKTIIYKANEIMKLIEENEKSVSVLQKYAESGKTLYTERDSSYGLFHDDNYPRPISFEDWEIRLIIHNKKQRIAALEKQLEQL